MLFLDMPPIIVASSECSLAGWVVTCDRGIFRLMYSLIMAAKVFLESEPLFARGLVTLEWPVVSFQVLTKTLFSTGSSHIERDSIHLLEIALAGKYPSTLSTLVPTTVRLTDL